MAKSVTFVTIGDAEVGKTSLLFRFHKEEFSEERSVTTSSDYLEKELKIKGTDVTVRTWDTAGQEKFRAITSSYYRGGQAYLVCFDLTNRTSFNNVPVWLGEIERYAREGVVKVLVGTKCDKAERAIPSEEIDTFALEHGLMYMETSAKDGHNVNTLFEQTTAMVLLELYGVENSNEKKLDVSSQKKKKKKIFNSSCNLL